MPTKEREPQIRDGHSVRESDKQRNDRQMEIIWSGAYFPEGWEAPHLTAPPASSDAGAVDRAKAQVEALKAAGFFSGPGQYRGWDDLPEAAKFYTLRHWVDWDGISQPDRAQIIGAQLDAYELAVLHIPEHQYHKAIDLPELIATAKVLAAGHQRDAMPTEEREPQIRIRPGTNNELGWRDDRSFDIHDGSGKIGFLTGYLGGPWSDADSPTEFRATHVEITAPGRKLSPSEWKDVLQGLRENLPDVAELVGWGKARARRVHERCPACGLKFEREQGYFLGAMYCSYGIGVVAISLLAVIVWALFGWDLPASVAAGFLLFLPAAPVVTFFSRVLWIYFDQAIDPDWS